MSTKIYDAYRLSSLSSIDKLFVQLQKIKQQHFEYVIHKMKSNVTWCDNYQEMRKQYVEVSQKMEKDMEDKCASDLNFEASICVVPYKKDIYVRFFLGDFMPEVKKMSFFKKNMRDFHYQNSTDKPKEVSATEWALRRKTWDAIFEKDSTFSDVGLVYKIFDLRDCHRAFWKIDDELMARFNIESPFRKQVPVGQKA
jgi:hypothetical protein